MKLTHTIDVRAEHIAAGERCSSTRCPIALALCEYFMQEGGELAFQLIHARQCMAEFYPPEGPVGYACALPSAARKFVALYDNTMAGADPFHFEITLEQCDRVALEQGHIWAKIV